MLNSKKHIVIVGPTASSKSSIAITLAQHFNNQPIISLDSMQIYKGFEIGTGVIPADERKNIEHHMLSFQDPTESYNAKKFSDQVNKILNTNENKFILVGGTGLYTHGIIDGFNFAPTDETIRQNIIEKYELDENDPDQEKVEIAYKKLQEQDPVSAEKK
ncbi:MAG: isopentenyl transferase family protein [Acidimicrobiia bacterium]